MRSARALSSHLHSFFSDGTLNVHVRKLREKLEEDPNNPKLLKTVWGTGYILEI